MTTLDEIYRPQFHFTAASGWLNDPNGLVYYDGEYHMFFQYHPSPQPDDLKWWGHAISPDLVHWHEIDPAIPAADGVGIWSGSAVVDWENASGLQTGAENVLLAFFTSFWEHTAQRLAYSNDRGRTWTRYAGNPVLDHIKAVNRDPKVFWHSPSGAWIMALYIDGNEYQLFSSPNAREWTHLSSLEMPECSECPDLFELPLDGHPDNTRWVFVGGSGDYMIGSFDGKRFTPETEPIRADYGSSYYATQTFSDIPSSDGRRIQITWMRGGEYPGMPFNQQMNFPCELTLRTTPNGPRIRRMPVHEIEFLHGREHSWEDVRLRPGDCLLSDIPGELFDIEVELEAPGAAEFSIRYCDEPIVYSASRRELSCLGNSATLEPSADGTVRLRVLLDRTSIEVFGNSGEVVMSSCFLPPEGAARLEARAIGEPIRVTRMSVSELSSIWSTK